MARARFQEGTLGVEGKGAAAHYYTRFRVYDLDGGSKRKQVTIGLVSKMSKREANKRKSEIIAEQTSQLPRILAAQKGEMSFEEFYKERFLVMKTGWSEAHRESFSYIMDRFVLPKFATLAIGTIDKVQVQARLNSLTSTSSKSTIKHVRTKMVEVFEEALEQEFINRNPASRTSIPSGAREPERPILTEAQLIGIIDRLTDARDKAIFLVGTFCAMRTSEIFGLPWSNSHEGDEEGQSYFMVDQIAYRGKRYKRTKNNASKSRVPIGARTLAAILQWKKESPNTSPDALVFASTNKNGRSKKGAPMCPGIWLQKKIHPIAKKLEVPFKVNFRSHTTHGIIPDSRQWGLSGLGPGLTPSRIASHHGVGIHPAHC
jgi:integrase